MNYPKIKRFVLDAKNSIALGLSLIFWLISVSIFYVQIFISENQKFVIHYNAIKEIDFVGGSFDVFYLLVLLTVLAIINSWIAYFLYYKEKFLSVLVLYSNVFIMFLGVMIFYVLSIIN